ncbi:hypothetical protein Pyn_12833 [Prunus yedoensis var. nudiflora]|uniref:CASP-like protein n=1 Tax=Prunus yedoensis var. nudiflora TaxID=2094558 RepID=A0A314UCN4_PRUYE|nr:hypothetical protein Pyn_12833 [Prunus yedoensis var. nudiflora]
MTKIRKIFTFLLRLLALAATLSATIVMVTSHDSAHVLNLTFKAKYSNSPAFMYFVIVEAIVSGYNLMILFLASKGSLWPMVIIIDVVVALLLTSSMSAALAIAQVGKKGNTHAGWLPICGQVHKFCNHVTRALVAGIIAAALYFLLILYTLYTVLNPLNRTDPKLKTDLCSSVTLGIRCSSSSSDVDQTFEKSENDAAMTGGAFDFTRATTSLTDNKSIASSKKVTLVRHGLSSWNEESRVQGSSNQSVLTETGVMQAERCRKAIANMDFDQCYSSPISRAKSTAEIIWQGREEPLVFLDSLKEAHLFFLEGMKNEDAKQRYPKEYTTWREDPANFYVNGIYPVRELWGTAREAWKEILLTPGEHVLVITHKSILRALICTALGLGPERFRAIDVNNGGISVFNFNKKGEAMIQSLNMTAHMYSDHIYLY